MAMNVAWKREGLDDEEDDSDEMAAKIRSEPAVNKKNTTGEKVDADEDQ